MASFCMRLIVVNRDRGIVKRRLKAEEKTLSYWAPTNNVLRDVIDSLAYTSKGRLKLKTAAQYCVVIVRIQGKCLFDRTNCLYSNKNIF